MEFGHYAPDPSPAAPVQDDVFLRSLFVRRLWRLWCVDTYSFCQLWFIVRVALRERVELQRYARDPSPAAPVQDDVFLGSLFLLEIWCQW